MSERREPLLSVEDLVVHRGHSNALRRVSTEGLVRVVDGVSLGVLAGESFGIVGESGCGKTTLALALLRLIPTTSGRVRFEGDDMLTLNDKALRSFRRQVQVVFQDPYASLHPRKRIDAILSEPFELHTRLSKAERRRAVLELLDRVGLNERFARRTAAECSGGQRQRLAIARSLALRPKLILLDEPVSALDVSIRAQIMDLLMRLQEDFGLTYIFISHDLALVRTFCHTTAVMYLGQIVESGATADVLDAPAHPYTRSLLEAVPIPDPEVERRRTRREILGEISSVADPPSGCRFHPRCIHAESICHEQQPELDPLQRGSLSRCHFRATIVSLPSELGRSSSGGELLMSSDREETRSEDRGSCA